MTHPAARMIERLTAATMRSTAAQNIESIRSFYRLAQQSADVPADVKDSAGALLVALERWIETEEPWPTNRSNRKK